MRFYVYRLTDSEGVAYVGKGSGKRLDTQKRSFGSDGEIIERFKSERQAYAAERRYIAEMKPRLNRHPGGNGSHAQRKPLARKQKWEREIEAIGTRRYAARILLACEHSRPGIVDPSKIEQIRQVAYGGWA